MATIGFAIFLAPTAAIADAAGGRLTEDFDGDWLFSKGDFASAMMAGFADAGWRRLDVPHDWSSEGPFSADYGSGNGYAPGGIAWYRKHFQLNTNDIGRAVTVEFDGVYDYAEVWINGQFVGGRPYGFSSFQFDLTPFVKFGRDNVIAVRVDHSRFADSRFYTGSGIYRNVRLVLTDKLRMAPWGVCVTTPRVKDDAATARIETTVENGSGVRRTFTLETEILGPDGEVAATVKKNVEMDGGDPVSRVVAQDAIIHNPQLWSLETPKLYRARTKVISNGAVVDETETPFGIRTATFDPAKGFFLNGKNMKIKGVCLHHDFGPLGAAVPEKTLERRLLTLKEIGVNAIRTSHNPPDPALLDLCDRLGFLAMDEAFDEFTPMKNKWVSGRNNGTPSHFGYGEIFAQWSVTDMSDLVRRDRNHPSVILWSIGNEIDYANDPFSAPALGRDYRPENPPAENMAKLGRPLIAAVKSLDRTRPVTAALATVSMSDPAGFAGLLDADGYNYQEARYAADHLKYPRRILYGSENSQQYGAWMAVKTNDFISGQFLWTGADYLGEAAEWPNRANGAGLLDLCGFKKPLAWFRQSLWSDKPMVYICATGGFGGRRGFGAVESWNWPSNATPTVICYANCPEVTLSLNERVIGTKKLADAINGALRWQVPFEPGTLKAVGRVNGQDACEYELKTAGAPSRIDLLPDATELRADGKEVCHIEFRVVDENGARAPGASPEVNFELSGPCRLLGIGNGDLNNVEDCKTNTHRAFQGRGLAVVQTTKEPGEITLRVTAPGLGDGKITVKSK